MDLPQMLDTFARMPAAEQQAWWRMAAAPLAVVVALLWLESRYFKPSRRVGSWLAVRLVSVLAALLAVAAVLLPARAVGGPAALGVFVLSLYTLGPVVWFGGHVLAGRWVRPALSRAESLVLGLTGLAIAAVPVYASLLAQSALQTAARDVAQRRELPATNPPLAHTVQPMQRYQLPGVGLIYTQSLLGTPDNRLLRVEQRGGGGQWPTHPHPAAHPSYCTHGNDVHLMWSAQEPPPYLRLHWAQSNGAPTKAEFTPQLALDPATPVPDFPLTLRPDGADPAAPIARERAYLVLVKEGAGGTATASSDTATAADLHPDAGQPARSRRGAHDRLRDGRLPAQPHRGQTRLAGAGHGAGVSAVHGRAAVAGVGGAEIKDKSAASA